MIPHLRFPAVSAAALEEELAREIEARRAAYPRLVGEGKLLQADADRELALARAWLEDARRWIAAFGLPETPLAAHGRSWVDRRQGLDRELGLRRRLYPRWIEQGRLTAEQAAHRIACVETLLALYDDGFDFVGPGEDPHAARARFLEHMRDTALRRADDNSRLTAQALLDRTARAA